MLAVAGVRIHLFVGVLKSMPAKSRDPVRVTVSSMFSLDSRLAVGATAPGIASGLLGVRSAMVHEPAVDSGHGSPPHRARQN